MSFSDSEMALLEKLSADKSPLTSNVYADWLEEQGDPSRAKFLRQQAEALEAGSYQEFLTKDALRTGLPPNWLVAVGDTEQRLKTALTLDTHEQDPDHLASWIEAAGVAWSLVDPDEETSIPPLGNFPKAGPEAVHVEVSDGRVQLRILEYGDRTRLYELIRSPEISPVIESLHYYPLHGGNGIADVTLDQWISEESDFAELRRFGTPIWSEIARVILCLDSWWEDAGQAGTRILEKAPRIEELVLAAAPDESFFRVGERPLQILQVTVDMQSRNFVRNLAESTCFPKLNQLRIIEPVEDLYPVDDEYEPDFEEYLALFNSPLCEQLQQIDLVNFPFYDGEDEQLLAIRSEGVQIR